MGKTANFVIGALTGAAVGLTVSYIFGPASGVSFDARYRSRWDKALDDGRRAADAEEAKLRAEYHHDLRSSDLRSSDLRSDSAQ